MILNGKKLDYLPAASEDQFNIKPIYKTISWLENQNSKLSEKYERFT